MNPSETPEELVFGALADPRRRQILEIVRGRPCAVGEIAARLPISQPAVSQHLAVLLRAGLVRVRPEGRRRLYGLDPAGLSALRRWADRMWDTVLDRFEKSFQEDADAPEAEG